MPSAPYVDARGRRAEVELPPELFDVAVNSPVMHEAVRAELAAARAGTHSTLTRAEVRGGGRKPWRQKGTGRTRHGSIREPQWTGGGIAHGPKPRDHSIRVNRKARALALRSALTDRARDGSIRLVDLPALEQPRTKRALELLDAWGAQGRTLVVLGRGEDSRRMNVWKSFRNLPQVRTSAHATVYGVLAADTVILTRQALESMIGSIPGAARSVEWPEPSPVASPIPGEDETGSES